MPCFCMVSGYFYQAGYWGLAYIKKYLWLIVLSVALYSVWNYAVDYREQGIVCFVNDYFSIKKIVEFFCIDTNSVSYHLWYLPAMIWTYLFVCCIAKIDKICIILREKKTQVALSLFVFLLYINAMEYIRGGTYSSKSILELIFIETTPYFLLGFCLKEIQIKHEYSLLMLAFIGSIAEITILRINDYSIRGSYMFTPVLAIGVFYVFKDLEFMPKEKSIFMKILGTSADTYLIHPIVIGGLVWVGAKVKVISMALYYCSPIIVYVISVVIALIIAGLRREIKRNGKTCCHINKLSR